jgi:hypothetical protein
MPKMVTNGWLEAAPLMGAILTYILYFTFFLHGPTDWTKKPICKHNGSNDAVWPKVVPFWVSFSPNFI